MNDPTISVIIPAYNAASTIRRSIDSVLAQTRPALEIIVVDDGSPDELAEVVQAYGPNVTLVHQVNSKTAAARNCGIGIARGDFVAFLDADDYWEPQKLEQQVAVLRKHPSVDVTAGRFYSQSPGEDRVLNPLRKTHFYDRPLRLTGSKAFLVGTMLWTGTVLIRRSVLNDQPFVSGLEPAEDRDLWIRLAADHTLFLQSEPLATAVLEPNSISRANIELDCSKMLEVIVRHKGMLSYGSYLLWISFVRYRWAAIDPSPSTSLPLLFQSFVQWPLPYSGLPTMKRFGRLKRLAYLLRQATRKTKKSIGVSA
ncbi:UDP-Glc:alpha-D-GlcNAc-diphosphoundecaprenol beta-1,3-glucosyltransferase WfgD [Planctomycetes bacterium CA13]|uniref:UDP-Glc:alpha-D-GlcNAc-diphosphoundecaprenol beta-1,3-glucosyltransferase WfgD n=1 Tax=Novipirellula herctigrandis TaxID=2527986 RepID=A0A5C5Z7H0_9BACT|nr:UDP-Glc:alpha-D-GlcNAc-diphosphoundecaprenol beta-1,3-glucosyltransferase WfgD [Planctomycetes bacterium CA13]